MKNCKYCMGTGIMIVPNGEDDIDLEVCNCKQNENSNRKSKRSVKPNRAKGWGLYL